MLPFIQLETDFLTTKAYVVAALLKVHRHQVVGMASDLFAFSVVQTSTKERPPDGVFLDPDSPTILEAVMGWNGEAGAAVAAFMRAGLIEKLEVGVRVRGMDRYALAWETATVRTLKAKAAAKRRWENARSNAQALLEHEPSSAQAMLRDAKTETETETDIETTTPLPPSGAAGELMKKPRASKPKEPEPEVDEVMAYYLEALAAQGKRARDSEKGRGHIRARLAEGLSVAECKAAIDGLTWSDHHLRNGFIGIKYALRSQEQMQMISARVPVGRRSTA